MDPQTPNAPVPQNQPSPAGAPAVPQQNSAKQQVVESLKGAKNVLVTLSTNPSVDALASALGLTFLLAKLDKHATAVFSGEVPSAMEFLDPEKTFENTVDSLRDFIIALDKEKADKLRYKVEDDVVKIFITPYKTTLQKDDFQFSQGDFNVDVVVALGVQKRDDLDKAITAHGRILHDATVVTVNTVASSGLGAIDWTDPSASSVAEMLMSMSEAFGSGLLDDQISTAFLTGIVAATNRFSNDKTSPKVMTMAAQLMAAGANQQLIATNLRREGMISEAVRGKGDDKAPHDDDGELTLDHTNEKKSGGKKSKKSKGGAGQPKKQTQPDPQKQAADGEVKVPEPAVGEPPQDSPATSAEAPTDQDPPAGPPLPDLDQVLAEASSAEAAETPVVASPPSESGHKVIQPLQSPDENDTEPIVSQPDQREETSKPMFGGTLNATTAGAEADREAQAAREAKENNVALSHNVMPPSEEAAESESAEDAVEAARQAVEEAAGAAPFDPAHQPLESIGAQPFADTQALHPVDPGVLNRQAGSAPPPAVGEAKTGDEGADPMQAFMQPHADGTTGAPAGQDPATTAVPQPPATNAGAAISPPPVAPAPDPMAPPLPPLPPLPGAPGDSGLPPLPPLPGQPVDPTTTFQPQTSPEFMQSVNQSQNPWTEAGQDMAAKQADKETIRQEKLDQMAEQYDAAVDKNRELQGKPPLTSNDHTTFPLPPTK